ncbi:MAG: murein biosynthesis integral membrane protein MurJ [Candidatus Woesebacteria bacterium]
MVSLLKKSASFLFSEQTSILSAATLIGSLSVCSAVLGILYKRLLVSVFVGESRPLLDAFFAAFRIPDFLFQLLVVGVLSATFIPVYSRLLHQDEEKHQFVQTLMTILGIAYIIVATIAGIFAVPLIRSFTGKEFSVEQVMLAAQLMRVMLGAQFFFLLSNFLSGILQSNRSFLLPALSPILYNLGIIVGTLIFSPIVGIYGPTIGVLLGAVVHFAIQLPLAIRYGFVFRLRWNFQNSNVREVFKLMLPRGATQTTNAVEDFVGVYIATSLGSTLLTSVTFAQSLIAAPIRFFGVSIAQAALPFLSSEAKDHDIVGFVKLLIKTLHQIAFFMYPAGALLLVLRIPIVRLAYGAKEFPWTDTVLLGQLVAIYAIAVGAVAMIHVLLRAFYALKETKVPFFIALVAMGINIFVMWLGTAVLGWGVHAIPLGFTIAAFTEVLLLLVTLFHRLRTFYWKEFFIPQGKLALSAILMGGTLYVVMKLLDQLVFDTTRVLGLFALTGAAALAGAIVYTFLCAMFSVEQLSILVSIQGRVKDWRNKLARSEEVIGPQEEVQL